MIYKINKQFKKSFQIIIFGTLLMLRFWTYQFILYEVNYD